VLLQMSKRRKNGLFLSNEKRSTYKRKKQCIGIKEEDIDPEATDTADEGDEDMGAQGEATDTADEGEVIESDGTNVGDAAIDAPVTCPEQMDLSDTAAEDTNHTGSDESSDYQQSDQEQHTEGERAEEDKYDQNEHIEYCYCIKIQEWCEAAGEGDLLKNLSTAIERDLLGDGNIARRLFSELLKAHCY